MALAVTTSPAHVEAASDASTVATASFNVPAGGVLLVLVGANSSTGGTTTSTVSTSDGKSVTVQGVSNFGSSGVSGYAAIATFLYPSSASGITVSVTTAGSTSTTREPTLDVFVVTGADLNSLVVSSGVAGSTTNNPTFNRTGAVDNTMTFVMANEWNNRGLPVTTTGFDTVNNFNGLSCDGSAGYKLNGVAGGQSYTLDAAGALAAAWNVVRVEVRPATAPTGVSAGADDGSHDVNTLFTRTGTQTTDGGQAVSGRTWTVVSGPASVGATLSTAALLSWTPTVIGTYVLRYSVTNSIGTSTDDMSITVVPLVPVVGAGADVQVTVDTLFSRTATEDAGGGTISARAWTIVSGPDGAGTTIGTAAALSWTPSYSGTYVLQYAATNEAGTGTDQVTVTVVPVGVELLSGRLGSGKRLAVEAAFGGDITDATGASWPWTEITSDVRVEDTIHIKIGRGDEASSAQPATCNVLLDNTSADYAVTGMSRHWPYVRRGTPIRVSVDLDDGSGYQVVFLGQATGWSPSWDISGANSVVKLEAAGIIRRLVQGDSPVISPMRRAILSSDGVFAYWPCEDGPSAANIEAAVGPHPMTFFDSEHPGWNPDAVEVPPELAQSSDLICSDPVLKIAGSEIYGHIGSYTDTGDLTVKFLVDVPDAGFTEDHVILGIQSLGTTQLWELRRGIGADIMNFRAWARGAMVLNQNISYAGFSLEGTRGQFVIQLSQNGSDIDWSLDYLQEGSYTSVGTNDTLAGYTFGAVNRIQVNTDGGNDDVGFGHCAAYNVLTSVFDDEDELNAFYGDSATNPTTGRIARLCDENDIPLTLYDVTRPNPNSIIDDMGAQKRDSLVSLIEDAEAVDHGVLWDGKDYGLSYTTRRYREARDAGLVIDAAAFEVQPPFNIVHDDQATVNHATARSDQGGSWTHVDVDGPMGTTQIGVYDDSQSYAVQYDESLPHFASWLVAAGTVEQCRYPSLTADMEDIFDRAADVLALVPGDRIDLVNLDQLRAWASAAPVQLALEGYSMVIGSHRWLTTFNLSPYQVWGVTILEDDVAEPSLAGDWPGRADTDGSELASGVLLGATSLSVTTAEGPLWTTDTDDLPLVISLGGLPVTVTAISGASSPQTFTVTGSTVPRAFAAGTPIKLWAPARAAI